MDTGKHLAEIEFALEQLVEICNNTTLFCVCDEVIRAEAALQRLYIARKAMANVDANQPAGGDDEMSEESKDAVPVVGEPVAVLRREIGEDTWFDWLPVRPGSKTHFDLQTSGEMDYCEVVLAPADSIPRARLDELLAAEKRVLELEQAFAVAYGMLWHVNAGMDAPFGAVDLSLTPERGAIEARKAFGRLLTKEQRGDGINAARDHFAALAANKGGA